MYSRHENIPFLDFIKKLRTLVSEKEILKWYLKVARGQNM